MRLPLATKEEKKPEKVKWTSVTFAQDMAANIAKAKKKKKKKDADGDYDGSTYEDD